MGEAGDPGSRGHRRCGPAEAVSGGCAAPSSVLVAPLPRVLTGPSPPRVTWLTSRKGFVTFCTVSKNATEPHLLPRLSRGTRPQEALGSGLLHCTPSPPGHGTQAALADSGRVSRRGPLAGENQRAAGVPIPLGPSPREGTSGWLLAVSLDRRAPLFLRWLLAPPPPHPTRPGQAPALGRGFGQHAGLSQVLPRPLHLWKPSAYQALFELSLLQCPTCLPAGTLTKFSAWLISETHSGGKQLGKRNQDLARKKQQTPYFHPSIRP